MVYGRLFISWNIILAIFIYGCKYPKDTEEKAYGDSLVIVTYHAPATINPLTALSGISSLLSEVIFDGLVRIDERLEARPSLASSWETSDNGLKWTFHLRRGVRFHDGVEFTAEDVKYTIEKLIKSRSMNPYAGGLRDIDSVRIRDRYTVDILLKRPFMFLLYSMYVDIVPSHILKGGGGKDDSFGLNPVGTGPFKFISWDKEEIVLEANREYFLGRPYLDKIAVKIYPNQDIAWAKLMMDEGDFLGPVNPVNYGFLNQVSFLKVHKTPGLHYSMIAFNNDTEFFNDRRVRMALNYAIDKEGIMHEVLKGNGRVAAGTIFPDSWAYNRAIKPYPYDPEKALSLLKGVGWRDTDGDHILDRKGRKFTFTLFINEGDEIKGHVAIYMQQQLWELGILMDIEMLSSASVEPLFQGQFDAVFLDIFSHVYPDFNYNFWHSSQIMKGVNICRYRSGVVDNLLERGRLSQEIEDAKRIYYRFQQEIHDNPPGIFLYWSDRLVGLHKRFRGVRLPPVGAMAYINEWYVPSEEQKYKF